MAETLTIDQVKEIAGKDPEFRNSLISSFTEDFVKAPPGNVIIRTKDEDQKFLDNHVNTVVEERVSKLLQPKVDEQFGQALSKIDAEILSITGIEKKPGEKTTAYAKRAVEEKRQGGDPVTKERVKQLEESLATNKQEYEKKLSEKDQALFSREVDWQINAELDKANVALLQHLKTDEEKQSFVKQQKALIKSGFLNAYQAKKDDQGQIIFYSGDQPQLSQKDGKPMSAGELIARDFASWFVPAAHVQTGTGTGSGSGNGAAIPAGGFKDKESIHKYLAAAGMEAGSKEYMQKFEALAQENKIRI
jgi:hypothetical protein